MSALKDAFARSDEARLRYLRDFLNIEIKKKNLRAFSLGDSSDRVPPDRRLAIGIAFRDNGVTFGLALRPSREDGPAYRAAMELADREAKDGSWADVRVIRQVAGPSGQKAAASSRIRNRFSVGGQPLMLGASVAHPKASAGSLGGFVKIKKAGIGIIGSCHVLANSGRGIDLNQDQPFIYHPAKGDAKGGLTAQNQVARLHNYVPLDQSPADLDVAVAELVPECDITGNLIPKITGAVGVGEQIIGPPPWEEIPTFGRVAKIGRTTGYREGRLSAGYFNDIPLDVPGFGIVYFDGLFEIEDYEPRKRFAEPGDSGAVVFDVARRAAFAMVVGGGVFDEKGSSRTLTYACDLAAGLDRLNAEWLLET